MTFDVQSNLVPDLLRLPSSFKKVPDSTEAPPTDSRRYTVAGEGLEGGPTTSFNSDYVPLRLFWPLIQSPKSKMCSCRIVPVTQFSNVRVNTTSTVTSPIRAAAVSHRETLICWGCSASPSNGISRLASKKHPACLYFQFHFILLSVIFCSFTDSTPQPRWADTRSFYWTRAKRFASGCNECPSIRCPRCFLIVVGNRLLFTELAELPLKFYKWCISFIAQYSVLLKDSPVTTSH